MISIWTSNQAWAGYSAAVGAAGGGLDLGAAATSVGEIAKPLAGVIVGFALARVSDWWRTRPNSVIMDVQTRSLYAAHVAGMSRRAWIQCAPDEARVGAYALVVINTMVHNKSADDDAIMRAELVAGNGGRFWAPAMESMVQAFVPVPIKAHGIEPLRFVFELARGDLGDELWSRIETSCFTLQLTTLRGQRPSKKVDLTNSFIKQYVGDPTLPGYSNPPPIRGYTDVRYQDGLFVDQTYFGQRVRFHDHELW
jgi:hypothetical protein